MRLATLAASAALAAPLAAQEGGWKLDPGFTETQVEGDNLLLISRGPVLTQRNKEIRASWAVFWIDPAVYDAEFDDEESERGELDVRPEDLEPERDDPLSDLDRQATLLDRFLDSDRLSLVREAYLEGPVEFLVDGELVASAGAVYVDRVDGHGWISEARYGLRQKIGGSRFRFKIEADWLRISKDGTLVSNRARVTTCEHEVPHYYIHTGELKLTPTSNPDFPYRVSLSDNSIRILGRFTLPLPPVSDIVDPEGRPSLGGIRVADTARFGPVLSLGYSSEINESTQWIHDLIVGEDESRFSSKFKVDASYLGSRGVLLDFGVRMRSEDRYVWNQNLAVVPDSGEDKGYVQVPESDRETLRLWYRSRARFYRGPGEWIDAVVTTQSDPGVQSEFFEDEYVEYEERQTYLHWRAADGALYRSATVAGTLDDWRTTTEEFPAGRLVWERQPLLDVGETALLYGLDVRGGYLEREQGDPQYEPVYPDGLGDEELFRADANQRLELPLSLGFAGLRATPFADARLTGWSQGQADDDAIGRAAALVGMRVATTFWRQTESGSLMEWTPSVAVRADLAVEESDDVPIPIDEVEAPLEGRFLEAGLRGRWSVPAWNLDTDAEVRATYADDTAPGEPDGLLPLAVLGGLRTRVLGMPLRFQHDGRYDSEDGQTEYSRSLVGFSPIERIDLTAAFTMGREPGGGPKLFEAVSGGVVFRFTPKWEFELGQSISLLGSDEDLDSRFELRRFGHDLLFEIGVRDRAGEGGTSISVSIKPTLTEGKRDRFRLYD